jgi:hypothetical protein
VVVRLGSETARKARADWQRSVHRATWNAVASLGHSAPMRPLVAGLERLVSGLHRPLRPYVALRLRA